MNVTGVAPPNCPRRLARTAEPWSGGQAALKHVRRHKSKRKGNSSIYRAANVKNYPGHLQSGRLYALEAAFRLREHLLNRLVECKRAIGTNRLLFSTAWKSWNSSGRIEKSWSVGLGAGRFGLRMHAERD